MSKFRVGDRVRIIKDTLHYIHLIGRTGYITSISGCTHYPIFVKFDDPLHNSGSINSRRYNDGELELDKQSTVLQIIKDL